MLLFKDGNAPQKFYDAESESAVTPSIEMPKTLQSYYIAIPKNRMSEWIRLLFIHYCKPMGYRKDGGNLRLNQADGLGKIINFQCSKYNRVDYCMFTINTGIYFESSEVLHNKKFKEYECILRARPCFQQSQLVRDRTWWTIGPDTDVATLWTELETAFQEQVLPWLAQTPTRESAIRQAIYKYGTGGMNPHTVARLLIDCGYGEELLPRLYEWISDCPKHKDDLFPFITEIELKI